MIDNEKFKTFKGTEKQAALKYYFDCRPSVPRDLIYDFELKGVTTEDGITEAIYKKGLDYLEKGYGDWQRYFKFFGVKTPDEYRNVTPKTPPREINPVNDFDTVLAVPPMTEKEVRQHIKKYVACNASGSELQKFIDAWNQAENVSQFKTLLNKAKKTEKAVKEEEDLDYYIAQMQDGYDKFALWAKENGYPVRILKTKSLVVVVSGGTLLIRGVTFLGSYECAVMFTDKKFGIHEPINKTLFESTPQYIIHAGSVADCLKWVKAEGNKATTTSRFQKSKDVLKNDYSMSKPDYMNLKVEERVDYVNKVMSGSSSSSTTGTKIDSAIADIPAEKVIKVSSESANLLKAFVNKTIKELDADPNITTFFIDTDKEYKKYNIQIPGICLVHADESMTLAALKKIPLIQKFDKSKTLMRYSDWKKGKVGDIEGVSWYCIYVSAKEARDNDIKALKEGVEEMKKIGYLNENGDVVLTPQVGDLITVSGEPYIVESVEGQTLSLINEESHCEAVDTDVDVRTLELTESEESGTKKDNLVCLGESELGTVYADDSDNVYLVEKVEMYWPYRNGKEVVLTGEMHDGLIEYWDLKGKLHEVPEEEFEKKFKKGSAKDLDLFDMDEGCKNVREGAMKEVDMDRQDFEEWMQSQDDSENADEADKTIAKIAKQAAEAIVKGQSFIFKGKNRGKVVEVGDGIVCELNGKKRTYRDFVGQYADVKFK